ncbi:methyl-accepting chemotaxis protein [Caballeronia grimmiae]|uniref:Chemotaxis protein n=1 Tax=Caballeronia grimmiae TaxID=1071679 RepID=A0A069NB35_9BURK|nr:methyl-accepting chemotaxis protein [Caballeronia grimmiae]KDR25307.1 chemotaxis protein [Caballeronia grimmiae]GGD69771.1 methyl-accepting chemotaxis protein [Caballeronia grimmiae]
MFKNLSVGARIASSFAAILLFLAILTAVGMVQVGKINSALTVINDINSVKQRYAINFRGSVHDRSIAVRDVTLVSLSELPSVVTHIAQLEHDYADSAAPMDAIFAAGDAVSDSERSLLEKIKASEQKTLPLVHQIIELRKAGDADAAKRLVLESARPAFIEWLAAINRFIDFEEGLNKEQATTARSVGVRFEDLMMMLTAIAVGVGALIAWRITRYITKALGSEPGEVKRVTDAIGKGDLAVRFTLQRGDEDSILSSLHRMQSSLRDVVSNVRRHAQSVATASEQIAIESTELSQRTESQASTLQQTAASMEQVTGAVQSNAENARRASDLATATALEVERGSDMVKSIVKTMDEITSESRKIADITAVIEGIAFQTNILALNAAVEAARAGEQGRGFAVVATEVRSLAQRSSSAAKEIKSLLSSSVERVNAGAVEINGAATAMSEILGSVKRVNGIVNEIAQASVEQAAGVGEVARAVAHMDETTQQNAGLVERTSDAATTLDRQSRDLGEAVAVFRIA